MDLPSTTSVVTARSAQSSPPANSTQMQRMPRYKEVIARMLAEGTAYHCYTSREELDALRTELAELFPALEKTRGEARAARPGA